MRRVLSLLAALMLLAQVVLIEPAPTDAAGERLVLAFYYAWFEMTTWDLPLPDKPSQPYASSDRSTMRRHVDWAKQAGIDAFVQSWYGPQVENNQTETNFAVLLDVAGNQGFSAAVDLEVTSPFLHSQGDVVAALQHLLTVHANHPAYLRVGGKPVVFFWRQTRFSVETWYSIRNQVDPNRTSIWITEGVDLDYLGPFDGNHLYSVAWDTEPEGTLIRWGQRIRDWVVQNGTARHWVATVMPGYDDRVTGRPDAFVRDRAGGAYYRRCWEGAIQSGADWVILTSFNEWMEGTQIEPSVGYGDSYLGLTRELGDAYRVSVYVEPTPAPTAEDTPTPQPTDPVPTPTSTATPTATPTETPTVIPTPSPTPTETPSPTPTPFPTLTPTPTLLPTVVPTAISPSTRALTVAREFSGLFVGALALALMAGLLVRRRH
jgi:hypothetical protein